MANSSSVIHVNVNSKVKNDASEILNGLGLNMSTAINIFLAQVVKRKGIPFEVKEPNYKRRFSFGIRRNESNYQRREKSRLEKGRNIPAFFDNKK